MLAPFEDDSCEIWVLGNRCDRYPRYDKIFEIHDDLSQHDTAYAQFLSDQNIPMVVGESFPIQAKHIEVFPYNETVELYGSLYLTSSSACMLAYAILSGHKEVELYGIDMAVDDHEYFWQRPCMESWVGFAKGMGIKVNIHNNSPLGKSDYVEGRDYGKVKPACPIPINEYSEIASSHKEKAFDAENRLSELNDYIREAEQLRLKVTAHDAARQVYERLAKVERAKQDKQCIKSMLDTVSIQ